MYRPDRGTWLLVPLGWLAAGIVLLWQRPATPIGANGKLLLRIAAVAITLIAFSAGAFFTIATFSESDSWARWITACLTFGIFGFPSSVVAIFGGAIIGKAVGGQSAAESICAVLLAITYFTQWTVVAVALLRRSMF